MDENIEVTIRQMREADIGAAMRLKDAEGWNQTEDDWRFLLSHDPELCLVACSEEKVIGTVTAINYNNQVAWIGMMLVDFDHRRRGVGMSLLDALLKKLSACRSVKLDASPAGNPVYTKLGFCEEHALQRLIAYKLDRVDSVTYSGNVNRIRKSDMQSIIDFDQEIFGANREALIRFLFESRCERAWIARRDDDVVGILSARQGRLNYQLGPLYARCTADAMSLVSVASRELFGKAVIIDIQTDKSDFKNWLLDQGFKTQRPLHRMFLGQNDFVGQVSHQYAICGPELG